MTLPPLPDLPKPAYLRRLQRPDGGYSMVPAYTPGEMRDYARAAIAAHVPEAECGNIAAVPAQPVAWTHVDYLTAAEHARQNDYPFAISAQARGPTPTHDVPLYAAPQGVPVPAWQPIETAPRGSGEDGPKMVNDPDYVAPPQLLLMTPDGMTVGAYDWYYHAGYGRGAEPGVPAWRQSLSSEPIYDATHWQPLPAAPKEQPHE